MTPYQLRIHTTVYIIQLRIHIEQFVRDGLFNYIKIILQTRPGPELENLFIYTLPYNPDTIITVHELDIRKLIERSKQKNLLAISKSENFLFQFVFP